MFPIARAIKRIVQPWPYCGEYCVSTVCVQYSEIAPTFREYIGLYVHYSQEKQIYKPACKAGRWHIGIQAHSKWMAFGPRAVGGTGEGGSGVHKGPYYQVTSRRLRPADARGPQPPAGCYRAVLLPTYSPAS